MGLEQEIYFDNAATTRTDPDIAALMTEVMCTQYGNPSSLHSRGVQAQLVLERAQRQVLAALGAKKGRVLFTSGGTEANNLALFGGTDVRRRRGNRIVTTGIEHPSVRDSARELQRRGFVLAEVAPGRGGCIDPEALLAACDADTILVSMMLINNETGAIQPVAEVVRRLRQKVPNALLHTDAVQAFGKLPFSVAALGVDMLTFSGHKIHAPKGVGALYLSDQVRVTPLFYGGSQQFGLRPGTESVPMAAALGLAAQNAKERLPQSLQNVQAVRERLVQRLSALPQVQLRQSPAEQQSPFVLSLSVPGYRSETLLHFLAEREIYVSSGSACSKGAHSHVLAAMGCSEREIDSALRLSFCRDNTVLQADAFADALADAIATLRHS